MNHHCAVTQSSPNFYYAMSLSFSIITCTWNSAAWLETCIASVMVQEDVDVDMIFVDGGSQDGSLELIRSLDRPYRLLENVRGGISHAMNRGLEIARGDVIAHLHSDDYYLHPKVLKIVRQGLQDSGHDWAYGRIEQDIAGRREAEHFRAPDFSYSRLLRRNFIPHPATFVRRALFERWQGFDTSLRYAMDYDLWLKFSSESPPLQLNTPLAAFRVHQHSASSSHPLAAMDEDFYVRLRHASPSITQRGMHCLRYLYRRMHQQASGARA